MKTGVPVGQVMRKNVLQTDPQTKIIDVAKLMAKNEMGSVIITENEKVIGILTEQDLARKVMAKGINSENISVSEVMTGNVHIIEPEDDIQEAMLKMGKNKIKHLPVIKDNKLFGIISFKDIVNIEPDLFELLSFKSSLSEKEKISIFQNEIK